MRLRNTLVEHAVGSLSPGCHVTVFTSRIVTSDPSGRYVQAMCDLITKQVRDELVLAVIANRSRSDQRYRILLLRLRGRSAPSGFESERYGDVRVCFEMLELLENIDGRLVQDVKMGLTDFLRMRGYDAERS